MTQKHIYKNNNIPPQSTALLDKLTGKWSESRPTLGSFTPWWWDRQAVPKRRRVNTRKADTRSMSWTQGRLKRINYENHKPELRNCEPLKTLRKANVTYQRAPCTTYGTIRCTTKTRTYTSTSNSLSRGVGIETRLRNWRSGDRIPVGVSDFSVLQNVETCSGAHPTSYSMGTGFLSRE